MRTFVTILIALAAFLCAVPDAQAGPLCRLGGLALRGGKAAAKAPLKIVKARPARRALGRLLGR